jgi:hypothetical protein
MKKFFFAASEFCPVVPRSAEMVIRYFAIILIFYTLGDEAIAAVMALQDHCQIS